MIDHPKHHPRVCFFAALVLLFVSCMPPDTLQDSDTEVGPSVEAVQTTTAPLTLDPTILDQRSFGEAPMLAEHVQSGGLPPVSERLPQAPLIIVPLDEIGTYGGTIRRALTGDIVQTPGVSKTLGENLMGYERPIPQSILLNLAQSYTFEDSGRAAVFKIRDGIKWSDGVPFTVEDILFWYNDMTLNADAREATALPSSYIVDGVPLVAEKVDDHRIRFRGRKPLGRMLHTVASDLVAMPKHFFAKFHPTYNADVTYETCRDSTTNAMRLYRPGTPVLSAWRPVEWTRGQRIVFERNPYYWKVDSAGNQLPYADRLVFTVIPDRQVIVLKFANGELDLFGRYSQINMYPTLKAEERKGKIRVRLGKPAPQSHFRLNWDTPRPELRQALRDRRVRLALNYSLNREEIAQIVYHGLLEPASHSFGPVSTFYSDEASQRHAKFDPQRARELLDEAGYHDSDGDGIREYLNGSPFVITLDVTPGTGVDVCQLAIEYWRDIGILIHMNVGLRDIIFPRWNNGQFEMFWWGGWSEDPIARPQDWGIIGDNRPTWHRNAVTEGPDWLREATDLILETHTTLDQEKLDANMIRVRELFTDQIPQIMTGFAYRLWGHNVRMGNVPWVSTASDGYRGWSRPIYHEQLYIKSESSR